MPWYSVTTSMTSEDKAELEKLAADLGVSRNQVMRFAIRYLLSQVKEGELDLTEWLQTTKKLKMP